MPDSADVGAPRDALAEVGNRLVVDVALRLRRGLPSLRCRRFLRELRPSLRSACERGEFRVLHYSVQANHLHLLVEAAGKQALGRGMKAISARVARAVPSAAPGRSCTAATTCAYWARRAKCGGPSPTCS